VHDRLGLRIERKQISILGDFAAKTSQILLLIVLKLTARFDDRWVFH